MQPHHAPISRQPPASPRFDPLAGCAGRAARRPLRLRPTPRAARRGRGHGLDLASNDYLGLSGDVRLAEAAAAAARVWGTGATGSRLVTGTTALHAELEAELAEFTGAAAALVFSSGYLANLAVVTALTGALSGDGVLIVSDERNHASLVDACRLARARVLVTSHGDVAAVAAALSAREERAAIVVTDAVFSVSGDLAPVAALHPTARAHGALLVVDEAHAFGVLGEGGRGAATAAGIAGDPDLVRTVTLSKSLAGQGGAVSGGGRGEQHAGGRGRGFIFDTGLAPPSAAAALAALTIMRGDRGSCSARRPAAQRLAARPPGWASRSRRRPPPWCGS